MINLRNISPSKGRSIKVSKHYSRYETTCKCGCGRYSADSELVDIMEVVRFDLGSLPIHIGRWFSCMEHNCRPKEQCNDLGVYGVGSTESSYHPQGTAVDFAHQTLRPVQVFKYLRYKFPDNYGVGLYSWGIHLDVGPFRTWND